jgi:glutamyl-Q tRNA(Asp) synthetase
MLNAKPVFRFAPSPNGYLHLGHAFSALFTQRMAREHGGRVLLRIEDIDSGRSRPEFEAAIYEDLAWLGFEWERPVRRQSEYLDAYASAVARLDTLGLVYPCFATRREIVEAVAAKGKLGECDPDGAPLYPGLYRNTPRHMSEARIAAGEPYALRLDMKAAAALAREKAGSAIRFRSLAADGGEEAAHEARPERWGDIVLARKEIPTSYHIAVVTDDALQGVTHVTRGTDLLAATDIHRLLQLLLDLPEPIYCHHRLIVDQFGRKLSKSHRDTALRRLREEGATASQIKRMVGLGDVL